MTGSWSTANITSTVGSQAIDSTALNNPGANWIQGNSYVLFHNVAVSATGTLS